MASINMEPGAQYLVTARMISGEDNAGRVSDLVANELGGDKQNGIQSVVHKHMGSGNWKPAEGATVPQGITPGTERYITHRLSVRPPNGIDITVFCEELHQRIAKTIATCTPSSVLDVTFVLDPMATPPLASMSNGRPATTNEIVCSEPKYVQ